MIAGEEQQRGDDDGAVDLVDVVLVDDEAIKAGELGRELAGAVRASFVVEDVGEQTHKADQDRGSRQGQLEAGIVRRRAGRLPVPKTGSRKWLDLVVAAEGGGDADPSADDGENGENDERAQHDPGALVDAVGVFVFNRQRGVRASVDGGAVIGQVMRFRAAFAEEGLEPEPEHVERGHAGGDEADEPEELAERVG